eukprot:UN08342
MDTINSAPGYILDTISWFFSRYKPGPPFPPY